MKQKTTVDAKSIFSEYKRGMEYKSSIGDKGISQQSKINERFYIGDQWYGAQTGNTRPLCRRNIVKRIGEYKLSAITSAPIAVSFSAEGVPDNSSLKESAEEYREGLLNGTADFNGQTDEAEISVIMSVLSDYFKTTAERVKFDSKKEQALTKAYIAGTGIIYAYWDDRIMTGLYADEAKSQPIKGDVSLQVIDIENVVFGDPNCDDVQKQPYIIISQRIDCDEAKREARRNRINGEEIENIKPDNTSSYETNAGTRGEEEPTESKRVTVLTKFYKEWDDVGENYRVMCVKVCEKAYIRKPWDTGLRLYPIAKICWLPRYSCAYGDSEITYQIPNQIAINRAQSSEIWAVMTTGMPKTIINGDTVTEPLTNNPGEIIKVYGTNEDVAGAVRHVAPPAFSSQLITAVNDLANNTLLDAGANDAALGNIRPDNASAIIQMREAALQPMQLYQNRFYDFIEDIARIVCDFWLHLYGDRRLKIEDKEGTFYVPFHASRYENLFISARIDVGSSPVWSIPATVAMLDGLYANQIIDKSQYLERIPDGIIPDKTGLIKDEKAIRQAAQNREEVVQMLAEQYPDLYAQYLKFPPEQQEAMLKQVMGAANPMNAGGQGI